VGPVSISDESPILVPAGWASCWLEHVHCWHQNSCSCHHEVQHATDCRPGCTCILLKYAQVSYTARSSTSYTCMLSSLDAPFIAPD
jgi:hypothetical protein